MSKNRAVVFAHYDPENRIDDYVVYYLKELNKICSQLVFVTTSSLPETELKKLDSVCSQKIVRENAGYDFMSWKVGLEHIGSLEQFDEVLWVNDSVYGPLYDLEQIVNKMESKGLDFWGMTDSYEYYHHIQSYFLSFSKKVLQSKVFNEFLDSIKVLDEKLEYVKAYELPLFKYLFDSNFKCDVFCRYSDILKIVKDLPDTRVIRDVNPTLFYSKILVEKFKYPFIKKSFLLGKHPRFKLFNYAEVINKVSNYDTDLIRKHVERLSNIPGNTSNISDKSQLPSDKASELHAFCERYQVIFSRPPEIKADSAWLEFIPFAYFLMDILKPGLFVELGVHSGGSFLAFCDAVAVLVLKTKCVGVDTWESDPHSKYANTDIYGNLLASINSRYLPNAELMKDSFDNAVSRFNEHSIDLLHIDGYHSYDAVKNDFTTWLPKVSERGVIIFHDILVKERGFGVYRFWEEVKRDYPAFELNFSHGLGVLIVGEAVNKEFLDFAGRYKADPSYQQLFNKLGRQIALISLKTSEIKAGILEEYRLGNSANEFKGGRKDTETISAAAAKVDSASANGRRMKWYTAISSRSPKEYFEMLDVAIYSCLKNTDFIPNILCDAECEGLEKWKRKGVNVIYFKGAVFTAFVEQFKDDERLLGIAGTYLRSNIPLVEKEDKFVLYTDSDVLFNKVDYAKFKINLPKYMACAPEFDRNHWSYFNAGSMIINVENMKNEYRRFADLVIPNFKKLFAMAHDQGAYNLLYKNAWERLPLELNWKPYWGYNENAGIIHFHGPKPKDIRNYFKGCMNDIKLDVTDNGKELYEKMINVNVDGCRKYMETYYACLREAAIMTKTFHTYVSVHDQDIISEFEKTGKFRKIFGNDYTYLFLGAGDVSKIQDFPNVSVVRNFTANIEQHKKMVTFTGWYGLVKNTDLKYDYYLMLEYDVVLHPKFKENIMAVLDKHGDAGVTSFIRLSNKEPLFYPYLDPFLHFIRKEKDFYNLVGDWDEWFWCATSNSMWSREHLVNFVNWFWGLTAGDEAFLMRADIGHIVERAITAYCILNKVKYQFKPNMLNHYLLDSHCTQACHNDGVQKDYKQYIKFLADN